MVVSGSLTATDEDYKQRRREIMIVLNKKKFAENEEEMIDSLFEAGGTCVGYAKRLKRKIIFNDINNCTVGVLNRSGCMLNVTMQNDAFWYSYANIPLINNNDMEYSEQINIPDSLCVNKEWKNGEYIYQYK